MDTKMMTWVPKRSQVDDLAPKKVPSRHFGILFRLFVTFCDFWTFFGLFWTFGLFLMVQKSVNEIYITIK